MAGAAAAAAAIALAVPQFTSMSSARTAPLVASPSAAHERPTAAARRSPARGVSSRSATAARSAAAAWIVGQVASSAVIGCDLALCAALEERGVNAERLVPLSATMTSAPSADVIAVPHSTSKRLVGRYAPAVIASFGSGVYRIDIRAVAPQGAAAYAAAVRADLIARESAGSQLLENARLRFSAADVARLRAGEVDSRLLATLAALSSQFTLRVAAFSDSAPGAPLLFRAVTIASGSTKSGATALAGARALVSAQGNPYSPARCSIVNLAAGQAGLLIQFALPSPLGLLSTVLTADTRKGVRP